MSNRQPTAEQLQKVVTEELPVIAEFIGDETAKVNMTIDDMISKSISQQAEASIDQIKDEMTSLKKHVVEPPYDPLKLALMLEVNTRLMRACHLRARNTVGLGWMVRKADRDEDEPPISEEVYKRQKKVLKALYENPNPQSASQFLPETLATPLDLSEIMYRMKVDEEATGNGYLEITRNNAGKIDGIYNIPAHTLRVLRLGGYVQLRGRWTGATVVSPADSKVLRRYFKRFGDRRSISRSTGQVATNLPQDERANELLPFHVFSSRSSYYGIPRWISAVAAIQGSRLAAIRNMAFFENDAVGRMAVVVSGGALTGDSVKDIRDFVNREGKGVEKSHRVMVLQAEPRKVISSKGIATKIDIVPLTVGINEDASFLGYRVANDEEVREASGLSSPFFTAANLNRSTATVLRKITLEQDLVPDLRSHQHVINRTISRDLLTQPMTERERAQFALQAELRFREPASVDELEQAQIQGMYARSGIVTINEARRALGLAPLPDELVYGTLPLPIGLALLEMGLLYQGAVTSTGVLSWEETMQNMLANEAAKAAVVQGPQEGQPATDEEKPPASTAKTQRSHETIQKLRGMAGFAHRLTSYITNEVGRDVLSTELILQRSDGEVLDRVALSELGSALGGEEESHE